MSVVPHELSFLEAAGASVTPTSLTLSDPDLDWESFENLGRFLGVLKSASSFWVGDLLNAGETLYGEQYAQVEAVLGISHQTLLNLQSVCRRVPKTVRRERVTFSAHAEVASLTPNEQRHWLKIAEDGGLSTSELRSEIHASKNGDVQPADVPRCESCGRPL